MSVVFVLLVAAVTFAVCFGIDKGFTKLFRSQAQHKSGLSVRLSRRYGSMGLIVAVLGVAGLFSGLNGSVLMIIGGSVLIVVGIGLVVYYMTFGVFYDADSFILTTFGKKSKTYRYADIQAQQLYVVTGGNVLVELHMTDGRTVGLQSGMAGAYDFLDHAFGAWCRQTGRNPEDCDFHDPANSLWFPKVEA